MNVRTIETGPQGPGFRRIGESVKSKNRVVELASLELRWPTSTGRISVAFLDRGRAGAVHALTPNAALSLAKALIEAVPEVLVAADDELIRTVKAAEDRARADGDALRRALS